MTVRGIECTESILGKVICQDWEFTVVWADSSTVVIRMQVFPVGGNSPRLGITHNVSLIVKGANIKIKDYL